MARERYLINAGEDTIHSNEIKLVTAKDKRENWWYYHKRQIIPAILVVALLAVFIHSMATKVDPDYTIGLLTSFTMPETGVFTLPTALLVSLLALSVAGYAVLKRKSVRG